MRSTPRSGSVRVRIRSALERGAGPVDDPRPAASGAARRTAGWSSCYAPHSSIYFDQLGKARACCQNTGTYLGDVTRQSIQEIWASAEAERMRSALEHDSYAEGCEFCEWQVREGNEAIVFARQYDGLEPSERRPAWPQQMEFALTNTCNLQCVMCNGEWSSAIRSQREHRPSLPEVYGEPFFEQLADYLPHLRAAKFAGGEPFLGREPLRVMEMLAELDEPPEVTIITNGTIFTPRVEQIVASLRPNIIVSIDGATPPTYDRIRQGAHLPSVLANLDRFVEHLGPDHVSITTCLMVDNWREFSAVLGLAEARDIEVGVNVVRFPAEHSLYWLPADELGAVVEALDRTHVSLTGARRDAWDHHRAALAHRVAVLRDDDPAMGTGHDLPGAPMVSSRWPWLPFPEAATAGAVVDAPVGSGSAATLLIDTDGGATVVHLDERCPIDLDHFEGNIDALTDRLLAAFPDRAGWLYGARVRPDDDDQFRLRLGAHDAAVIEMVGTARRDEAGQLIGAEYTIHLVPAPLAELPPRLGA